MWLLMIHPGKWKEMLSWDRHAPPVQRHGDVPHEPDSRQSPKLIVDEWLQISRGLPVTGRCGFEQAVKSDMPSSVSSRQHQDYQWKHEPNHRTLWP
jgi:hypothetical protein